LSTSPRSGKIGDLVNPTDVTGLPPGLTSGSGRSSGWPSGPPSRFGVTEDDQLTAAGSDAVGTDHTPADELTPGTAVGRYMILSRLGAGAMGVVYAAYDPELDRKVALKLVLPHTGDGPEMGPGEAAAGGPGAGPALASERRHCA